MMHIRWAVDPYGDPVHLRERDRAVQFLLDHATEAYPRLLDLVTEKPHAWETPALIDIIGRFRRDDCVPLLQSILLQAIPDSSRAAARALADIGNETAHAALVAALEADQDEVTIAALDGIRLLQDSQLCQVIMPMLGHANANLRYYAVNTAIELACLGDEELSAIASSDTDNDIRALAAKGLRH